MSEPSQSSRRRAAEAALAQAHILTVTDLPASSLMFRAGLPSVSSRTWVCCPALPPATTLAEYVPCRIRTESWVTVGEPTSVQPVKPPEKVSKSELESKLSTIRVSFRRGSHSPRWLPRGNNRSE